MCRYSECFGRFPTKSLARPKTKFAPVMAYCQANFYVYVLSANEICRWQKTFFIRPHKGSVKSRFISSPKNQMFPILLYCNGKF